MQPNDNHIEQYSAATLQQYVKGELPATTMHAIEKAALDDPFLADAIEGMELAMQQHDPRQINTQLDNIRTQVQSRTTTTAIPTITAPKHSFRWWQIAAAAVVLLFTGFAWYYYAQPTDAPNVMAVKAADSAAGIEPMPQAAAAPSSPKTGSDTTLIVVTEANLSNTSSGKPQMDPVVANTQLFKNKGESDASWNEAKPKQQALAYRNTSTPPAAEYYSAVPDTLNAHKPLAGNYANKQITTRNQLNSLIKKELDSLNYQHELADNRKIQTEVVRLDSGIYKTQQPVTAAKPEFISSREAEDPALFFVRGRVMDYQNNPLSNVLVKIERPNKAFSFSSTDQNGLLNIPVPVTGKDSSFTVALNATGFKNQNFRFTNNASLVQPLKLESTSNGLIGYMNADAQNRQELFTKARKTVTIQAAQPEGGWVAYEKYLAGNKKVPEDNPNVTGKVVISFEVNNKGALSNFRTEQSIATDYDNEAIRLIKEGPHWKLLRGKKTRVTVIVQF